MTTVKELSDKIMKAMEGVTPGQWTLHYEIDGPETQTRIKADRKAVATTAPQCGRPHHVNDMVANAAFIALCNPTNMRLLLSALADMERERDYSHDRAMRLAGFLGDEPVQQIIARAEAAEAKLAEAVKVIEGLDGNITTQGLVAARSFLASMGGE